MKQLLIIATLLTIPTLTLAGPPPPGFKEMHLLNDGYTIATFQKYVGPEMHVCSDETVDLKKDSCGTVVEGITPQQYLDLQFGPNVTRVVGLAPQGVGKRPTKTVIYYQITRNKAAIPLASY